MEITDIQNEKTYDLVFWNALNKLRRFVIPLVNEIFGETYSDDSRILIRNNKHTVEQTDGSLKEYDTDGYVELSDRNLLSCNYNFECEAWYDKGIAVRIEEYESAIALENIVSEDRIINVYHPKSAVIFLHYNPAIPSDFEIRHWSPDKDCYMGYVVPAIQLKDYSILEIFEKRLLLLLPYYAFCYSDREYREMNRDVTKMLRLIDGLDDINTGLSKLVEQNEIDIIQVNCLWDMIERVFEKVTLKYANVMEGVKKAMGGYILYTRTDEIFDKGIEKGIEKGRTEERHNAIANMLSGGKTPEEITEFCGYTMEQILEVQKSMMMV